METKTKHNIPTYAELSGELRNIALRFKELEELNSQLMSEQLNLKAEIFVHEKKNRRMNKKLTLADQILTEINNRLGGTWLGDRLSIKVNDFLDLDVNDKAQTH